MTQVNASVFEPLESFCKYNFSLEAAVYQNAVLLFFLILGQ